MKNKREEIEPVYAECSHCWHHYCVFETKNTNDINGPLSIRRLSSVRSRCCFCGIDKVMPTSHFETHHGRYTLLRHEAVPA
jgi:hypothetical protein